MDFAFLKKIETGYEELISKVSKKTLKLGYTYLFVIVYKVLLDFIYCRYIGDLYAFHYIQISEVNVVTGWVAILIMAYFLHLYYMLLLQFCQLSYCLINQYIICRKTHDNSPTYIPKMTEIVARKRTP